MDARLHDLILDYQSGVCTAIKLLEDSGIPCPGSDIDWIATDIPQQGLLADGSRYFKHGAGCNVHMRIGIVCFDFGEYGQIDGFTCGALATYAGTRLSQYGFAHEDQLKQCFDGAVAAGQMHREGPILYFLNV